MIAAAALTLALQTPRGAQVVVTAHLTTPQATTIVVAPGQSCNSKGPIFEALGTEGQARGYNVVRFEWSYCRTNPAQPEPSPNLTNEIEDYQTVLKYARTVSSGKIVLAGKSLGSMVAAHVFAQDQQAFALVLLTPVCDENSAQQNYPALKIEKRPVIMALGNKDDVCPLPMLYTYLAGTQIPVVVGEGPHNLMIYDKQDKADETRSQRNISSILAVVLNWIDQLSN